MNKIEQVARALAADCNDRDDHNTDEQYGSYINFVMPTFRAIARVAIMAMHEPTERMKTAGGLNERFGAHETWKAMVEAALNEE